MVTLDNAEEYVELMFDFCMHTGIQKQMEAFRGKRSSMYAVFHYTNQVSDVTDKIEDLRAQNKITIYALSWFVALL